MNVFVIVIPSFPLNAQLNACHFCDLLVSYVCLGKRIYDTETQGGITRESEKASRNIWTSEPKNKKGPTCYGRSDRIPSEENSIPDMTGGNEFFLLSSSHSNEALLVRRARAKRIFSISCDSTNKLTLPASVQSLLLFARKLITSRDQGHQPPFYISVYSFSPGLGSKSLEGI